MLFQKKANAAIIMTLRINIEKNEAVS